MRNESQLVFLDAKLHEVARVATPKSPTGLSVLGSRIFVCGELSPMIARYEFANGAFTRTGSITIADVTGLRDLAIGPENVLYVADEHDGKTLAAFANENAWTRGGKFEQRQYPGKMAPFRIARVGRYVLALDLLAHSLEITSVDARGFPIPSTSKIITHDGPIWSFDARETASGIVIAAGGVEDRKLDRSGGFFGWIDSFVFLYEIQNGVVKKIGEQNISELGVITPKAISLHADDDSDVSVFVTGYGGENAARISWSKVDASIRRITAASLAPGSAAIAEISAGSYVVANSLLDGWESISDDGTNFVSVPSTRSRSLDSKIGEAIFFTSIMAPDSSAERAHSRFTCETCHFEGYVDGRTHFTGREDIHATTKPLRGLVNNRPHFSRALDPDLATVSMNEFRVANAGNETGEWFALNPADFPWLHEIGVETDLLGPEDLRRDLVAFLMDFSHSENPATENHHEWSDSEARGAKAFDQYCARCHEPRLAADDPKSRVANEEWKRLVFDERGALVWARSTYEKTGVTPYVHELGTRIPGLRRLYKKRPYFTNGSAPDLASVLSRARLNGEEFFHDDAPANYSALSTDE